MQLSNSYVCCKGYRYICYKLSRQRVGAAIMWLASYCIVVEKQFVVATRAVRLLEQLQLLVIVASQSQLCD